MYLKYKHREEKVVRCWIKMVEDDLFRLAVFAEILLTPEKRRFLDAVTDFNIEARYPDIKLSFYRKATREFTEEYIKKIKEFFQWLRSMIKL